MSSPDDTPTAARPTRGGPAAPATRRAPAIWAGLCAAGAGLVLLAAGRDWAEVRYGADGGPRLGQVAVTGADLAAYLSPAAVASLAAVAAVLVARGVARRLIGVVVALCGVAAAVGAATGPGRDAVLAAAAERSALSAAGTATYEVAAGWPAAALAGGIILVAGGVYAVARAGRWPGLSERYERRGPGQPADGPRPARAARAVHPDRERDLWDALDRGADPTADADGQDRS